MPSDLPDWYRPYRAQFLQRLGEVIWHTPLKDELSGYREGRHGLGPADASQHVRWLVVDGIRTSFQMDDRSLSMKLKGGRGEIRAVLNAENYEFVIPRVDAVISRDQLDGIDTKVLSHFTALQASDWAPGEEQVCVHTAEDLIIAFQTFKNSQELWWGWYVVYITKAAAGLKAYFEGRSRE